MNYWIILLIVLMDQISKIIVQNHFALGESIPVIPNIFHLTYVQNVGAAFGIFKYQRNFFIFVTTAIIIGIFIFTLIWPKLHHVILYSFTFIIGGAIGNLLDRIRLGYVIDFFDFQIWPVFNIADISIVAGTMLLAYYLIFLDKEDNAKDSNDS